MGWGRVEAVTDERGGGDACINYHGGKIWCAWQLVQNEEEGRRRIQNGTEVWVMRMVMPLVSIGKACFESEDEELGFRGSEFET